MQEVKINMRIYDNYQMLHELLGFSSKKKNPKELPKKKSIVGGAYKGGILGAVAGGAATAVGHQVGWGFRGNRPLWAWIKRKLQQGRFVDVLKYQELLKTSVGKEKEALKLAKAIRSLKDKEPGLFKKMGTALRSVGIRRGMAIGLGVGAVGTVAARAARNARIQKAKDKAAGI